MSEDNVLKKQKAKQFAAFITDVAIAMKKHKVDDLVAIFELNGEMRNTYIPLKGEEDKLFCDVSDVVNEFLQVVKGFSHKQKT